MHHERDIRIVSVALTVAVGLSALAGCAKSQNETAQSKIVNCQQNPGDGIETTVDMREVGDDGSLTVRGLNAHGKPYTFDIHSISVYSDDSLNKSHPNTLSVGTKHSPVGVGGTRDEIAKYGVAGMPLFGNEPRAHIGPPYYEMVAFAKPNSAMVLVKLMCDTDQSPH